jgi:hypothetical protein
MEVKKVSNEAEDISVKNKLKDQKRRLKWE